MKMSISILIVISLAAPILAEEMPPVSFIASSQQLSQKASMAMDGKMNTRWASDCTDDQWLQIEFDTPREIVGINLHWETAYGRDYDIEVLEPNGKWLLVSQTRSSDGGIDAIYFGLQKAKGLRIVGHKRGTGWGYSLWEIDLLGQEHLRSAKASTTLKGTSANMVMDGRTDTYWQSVPDAGKETILELTSPQKLNVGGLKINWAQPHSCPCRIDFFSDETDQWVTLTNKKAGVSGTEDLFFKAISTKKLRLVFPADLTEPVRIADIQIKEPGESWTPTRHFEMLAQRMPDGMFPGWLSREQTFWTVTGLVGSFNESLLDEHGRVESGLRNFSVTPLLVVDGKIRTPKSFKTTQTLADDWAPIPSVQWRGENLNFNITANTIQPDTTLVLYTLKNTDKKAQSISLLLAVRPLPINPPWQHGGHITLNQAQWSQKNTLILNNTKAITVVPNPSSLSLYAQQPLAESVDITELLLANETQGNSITSSKGLVSAGMRYDYHLEPGETKTILAVYPNTDGADIAIPENREAFFHEEADKSLKLWQKLTGDWEIDLPDKRLSNIIRSNLAYLLINADGPATQPGSRNYNSSWIRDGAISATAMIRFGLIEPGVNYLKWITNLVRDDGFVPFIVETKTGKMEGFANNWQEYDSFGEYVFIARQAVETTNDNDLAELCWPRVKAAMKYMENLRNQRLTEKYKGTEYEGILPESQSHEGYIDPPRHSYWDDFFAIKGIQDARAIALRLGHNKDAEWLAKFENDLRASILTSMERVRKRDGLATLPACAELGDFDPTSTAIGVMIADERDTLPADALRATFDRYMEESRYRAAQPLGTRKTYTPYEVRNISAMIRLGHPDDAIMLTDYFVEDAVRPAGWNHMAEVVHTDPRAPSYIGDMPHTWVGAGFINAVRDMLVYEERDALVLAAAVPDKWLDRGITVRNLQTWWGPISYSLKRHKNGKTILKLQYSKRPPNGFIVPKGVELLISSKTNKLKKNDEKYLREIIRQTWTYLDAHLAKETGFPTDSQHPGGTTNTTNIGLYLASIGPAEKMGFITRKKALQRIDKIVKSLKKVESQNGFLYNHIDVCGAAEMPDAVLAVSDFNKLITGLILVRQFFPETAENVSPLIERVDWRRLYDTASGKTYWGYNAKTDKPVGLGNFWLASDCRMVVFYMIASGAAPAELWDRVMRNKIQADGLTFYDPGYRFGGLFMAAMDAIFLNELATEMGSSIADLAWHQIRKSRQRGLKVWGWSNCNVPGKGYTEGGFLPWWVVTPHASALVIEYYPRHVIANLRKLSAMGLRRPLTIEGKHYGFRDSVDLKTGKVDDRYLSLDQAMLFLSLTNFLEQAMVRRYFANDPLVKNGIKLLGSRLEQDNNLLKKWAKRDASEPELSSIEKPSGKNIVLNMKQPGELALNTNVSKGSKINSEFTSEGLVIDFVLDEQHNEIDTDITFPPMDLRNLDSIRIICSSRSKEDFGGVRLYLCDDQGQSQYMYVDGIGPELQKINIPNSSILGMLAKPYAVNKLTIKLWARPWYYTQQCSKAKSGKLVIEKIVFRRKQINFKAVSTGE